MPLTLNIHGVTGPTGEAQRGRVYNTDGSALTDIAMTETPAGSGVYDGTVTGVAAPADNTSTPLTYEVRSVSAQTSDAFDDSVTVRRTLGAYGYVVGGAIVDDVTYAATLPNPAPAGYGAQATAGSDQCTLTLTDGASPTPHPIANASVWITADAAGDDVVAGVCTTDIEGRVKFLLTAGDTYYLWMERDGFNPILGQAFAAVADS